jgi:predicted Zn-dependent protease
MYVLAYVYTQAQHLHTQWKLERQAAAQRFIDPQVQAVQDFNGYVAALLAASTSADSTAVDDSSSATGTDDTATDATELDEPWVKLDEV